MKDSLFDRVKTALTAKAVLGRWVTAVGLCAGCLTPCRAQVGPGSTLRFDGTNGYVSVLHSAAFNSYPFTATAWIRTTNTGVAIQGIVSKYVDASGNGWTMIVSAGNVRAFLYRDFGNFVDLDGGFVADGRWHHIAFVADAGGGSIFVDGVLRKNVPRTGNPTAPTGTAPLQIGRYHTYPSRFQGDIDEVSVWNQALQTNTLNYIKHRSLSGREDGLVGLWRLDDGAGTLTTNAVAGGTAGSLLNSPAWVASTAPIALASVADRALKLDGADDQIVIPHDASLNAFPLTVMAWVKTSQSAGTYPAIAGKYQVNSLDGWGMALNQGRLHCWYYRSSGNGLEPNYANASDRFIADGQWHHVAFVVDANSGRLFIDGQLVRTEPWTGTAGPTTSTTPLRLGNYTSSAVFLNGSIDHVSIWNVASSPSDIAQYSHLPLTGGEPGLVAAYEMDEASGTAVVDLTGNFPGTGQGGFTRTGSLARIGDGSQHLLANLDRADYGRFWALGLSATANTFPIPATATFRRFHDFGDAPAPVTIDATIDATLSDDALQPAALNGPAQATFNFVLPSENANAPATNSVRNLTSTLLLDPVQLASVNNTHATTVTLAHSEDGAVAVTDEAVTLPLVKLLDFNGTLLFGTTETRFSSLANTPFPGAPTGGGLATILNINNNSGFLVAKPTHHFGTGGNLLNVTLFDDGHTEVTSGTLLVNGPVPDREVLNGISFDRTNITISPAGGLRGTVVLRFPTGFSLGTATTDRITTATRAFANTALDDLLIPQSPMLVVPGPIFGVEETKPFWMQTTSLEWNLGTGLITLDAPTLYFVRQEEDDLLTANGATLAVASDANRVSNDGYFRDVVTANGPAVLRADANGAALLSLDLNLGAGELRPHFPYTTRSAPGIVTTGGPLVIADDLVNTIQSALQLSGPVPVSYARDCSDTNCAGVVRLGPLTLEFTTGSGQLAFTPDGGLFAYGTVPPQNLTWGFVGGADFAQRTSDVEAGAFQMPGTFLRGDQTTLSDSNRPAVLLFTGDGNDIDPAYRERPGEAGYADGFANYAGLNFRAPALGQSHLAKLTTPFYPLIPEAKYYARPGGISGIHQAASFPSKLRLYGYDFTITRYALSYLDSDNWQSRTDGSVHLPGPADAPAGPAGFDQEFAEMKLLCRGGLGSARIPDTSGEKYLNYWNTYFTPLSMEFRATNGDSCNLGNRFLVLGVETKLPFIPQRLHAALGFYPNGNLVTVQTGVQGVDSRFPVPAQLSLQGPTGGKYRFSAGSEGYFNNWETPGRPPVGFYNLAGKLDLPFFEDSKVHLHVTPISRETADVHVMGGWRSADKFGEDRGWTDGGKHFFNLTKFDPSHRGFPGADANSYRDSQTVDYHPRAQREWLEIVRFDYPLAWNKTTHRFASFEDSTVVLPVLDVSSRLKDLTPGKIDIDFSQDINLSLPRIKLLDLANDALDEFNGPLLSVSNALREAFVDLSDASGLTKGSQSMQRVLRDAPEGLFRPILDPALDPAVNALYSDLASLHTSANPATFLRQVSNTVVGVGNELRNAAQSINGAAGQANSVVGGVNQALTDVDDTIGLFIRIVGKDPATGKRRAVRIIVQKIVKDQAPDLGFVVDAASGLADDIVNALLTELEPTLAEVEGELVKARAELNKLRSQLGPGSGEFKQAITSATSSAANLNQFVGLAGSSLSNLMFLVNTSQGDFFTANPAEAKRQIKQRLIVAFLNSTITAKYQETFKQFLYDDHALVNQLLETLFQQINKAVRDGLQSQIAAAKDGVFQGSKGPGSIGGSLLAAKVRGAPEFNGDALRKIRLDADVRLNLPDEMNFGAFLEIRELDSSNTPIGCMPPGGPSAEVTLGAIKVPLKWAGLGDSLAVDVAARWNLNSGVVYGIGGSIQLSGKFDVKGVSIDYLGAALAIGEFESYFVARAKGTATAGGYGFGAEVGFFAGKTCHIDPLKMVDPEVEKILEAPNEFSGIYVQFGGVFPLTQIIGIPASCLLRADGNANTILYYRGGPRLGTIGGKQTIGLDVELLCILSGSVKFTSFFTVSAAQLVLGAEAEVCGKIGACPFCLEGCADITIKGVVNDGGIDYSVDF